MMAAGACCSSRFPIPNRSRTYKQIKNRVHLDLKPADGTQELELERLLGLGAREVADRRVPDGSGCVVLADPEGNAFCILRSDAERQ